MYTIKTLARGTNSQPQEIATWLSLDNWNNDTPVSHLDALTWIYAIIDTATDEGCDAFAHDLLKVYVKNKKVLLGIERQPGKVMYQPN